jgi:hypothetical protein
VAEIFQDPYEIIETPTDVTPPPAAITPRERGGLLLETELTPLERELAPPPAAGMPPTLDRAPAAADLELVSIDEDPRPCYRVHNRRFPTPVKARSIETAIRQTLFERPDRLQTGHDSSPFLRYHLDE